MDFAELAESFFEQSQFYPTKLQRLRAIGHWRGRTITVIFKPLGAEAVSVISMRPASPQERKLYGQQDV